MFCKNCGMQLTDNTAFCPQCGTKTDVNNYQSGILAEWFYFNGVDKTGPFTQNQIVNMISAGTIVKETLVWKNGLTSWTPAGNTELAACFGHTAAIISAGSITEKWVWALATIPLLVDLLIAIAVPEMNFYVQCIILCVINCIFITQDVSELKNNGYKVDDWLWLGIVLVPVYLYVRASKTTKNYIPFAVWCGIFVFSLLL